jgi:Xaa-Pro aminopeptidase
VVNRVQLLQRSLEKNKLDGYLISDETNILYFTGFLGAYRLLVPDEGDAVLYVYGTNYEAAKKMAKNCTVELLPRGKDADKMLAANARKLKIRNIGFCSLEVSVHDKLKKALAGTKLTSANQLVRELREVKDAFEITCIRKAAELTDVAARRVAEVLKPGIREYEVAAEAEYAMRKRGSEGPPPTFDTIVASGLRSAFPHGGCTSKRVRRGELIQFDVGARCHGYAADLTRTFLIGKPTPKQRKIYEIVKEAQEKAFQVIRHGVKAKQVDATARTWIKRQGFGENFPHGLGHGVGLEVHEPPTLNTVSKDVLKAGNVVTDEPGIYILGYGGIRIEDTVFVKKDGAERLTKAPYPMTVN